MNRFFRILSAFAAVFALQSTLLIAQEDDESADTQPQLSDEERAARVEDTVALARSYLGGAKQLEKIETIHFEGVLVYGNGQSGTVDSVFKKPNYHQFTSVVGGVKETSTLNKTEAWRKAEDLKTPGSFQLTFYEIDDVRHLQATVEDALGFHSSPETRKGRIEYLGTGDVDGTPAVVLYYIHSDRIWFRKYFDPETGRLMHMVNDKGVVFSYEGEIEASGVKFPQKVLVRFLTQFGEQTMEISYSKVTVNEKIDTERFRVPISYD